MRSGVRRAPHYYGEAYPRYGLIFRAALSSFLIRTVALDLAGARGIFSVLLIDWMRGLACVLMSRRIVTIRGWA